LKKSAAVLNDFNHLRTPIPADVSNMGYRFFVRLPLHDIQQNAGRTVRLAASLLPVPHGRRASGRPIKARHNNPLPRTSCEKCSASGKTLGLMPSATMNTMFLGGAPDLRAA
jgi:hypothetical protein